MGGEYLNKLRDAGSRTLGSVPGIAWRAGTCDSEPAVLFADSFAEPKHLIPSLEATPWWRVNNFSRKVPSDGFIIHFTDSGDGPDLEVNWRSTFSVNGLRFTAGAGVEVTWVQRSRHDFDDDKSRTWSGGLEISFETHVEHVGVAAVHHRAHGQRKLLRHVPWIKLHLRRRSVSMRGAKGR